MSKTTTDPGTPIFGELNKEFELPEIVVHDFDEHAFQLQEISLTEEITESETVAAGTSSETAESDQSSAEVSGGTETDGSDADQPGATTQTNGQKSTAAHAGTEASTAVKNAPKRPGGRRRKEE